MLHFKDFVTIALIVLFFSGCKEDSESSKAALERLELNLRKLLEHLGLEYELCSPPTEPSPQVLELALTNKISAIKQLREETGLGLKEAKEAVEEMLRDEALRLYAKGSLPLDEAQKMARMSASEFRQTLETRQVPLHAAGPELAQDPETLPQIE